MAQILTDDYKFPSGTFNLKKFKPKYKVTAKELTDFKAEDFGRIKTKIKTENLLLQTNIRLANKFATRVEDKEAQKIRKAIIDNIDKQDYPVDYDDFEFLTSTVDTINDLYQEAGFVYKNAEDIINDLDISKKDKVIMYSVVNCLERFAITSIYDGKTVSIPHNGTISMDWKYLVKKDNKELLDDYKKNHTEEEFKEYKKKVFKIGKERLLEENNKILLNRSAKFKKLDLNYRELILSKDYRKFNADLFKNIKIVEASKDEEE